jgi:HEPN domain-containing protein
MVSQAKADLKTARDDLERENYYASCFFSQQSAEKALKALLILKGFRAIITHSTLELVRRCSEIDERFKAFVDPCKELDKHYIGSRYPNFYPEGAPFEYYTREDAEKCLSYAESILREVERFMGS